MQLYIYLAGWLDEWVDGWMGGQIQRQIGQMKEKAKYQQLVNLGKQSWDSFVLHL